MACHMCACGEMPCLQVAFCKPFVWATCRQDMEIEVDRFEIARSQIAEVKLFFTEAYAFIPYYSGQAMLLSMRHRTGTPQYPEQHLITTFHAQYVVYAVLMTMMHVCRNTGMNMVRVCRNTHTWIDLVANHRSRLMLLLMPLQG